MPTVSFVPPYFSRRGLLFCALAVLLHLCVLQWAERQQSPLRRPRPESKVAVEFRNEPDNFASTTQAAVPRPARAKLPLAQRKPAAAAPTQPDTENPAPLPFPPAAAYPVEDAINTPAAPAEPPAAPATVDSARFAVSPPPSGVLRMQLVRSEPNRHPVYGVGEIRWEVSDGKYRMRVTAALDLLLATVNLYQLESEGTLGSSGIMPAISTETRRSRSATATHFDQQNKNVNFSASNKSQELVDGAQDKATILMQLAGMGQADPGQFQSGREIAIQVAEERDANTFVFIISGQEEIDSKLGKLQTWHIVRPPRPGSYNSQLEIWLAPDHAWYPVQIRNTESNGAVTTQTVTHISNHLEP